MIKNTIIGCLTLIIFSFPKCCLAWGAKGHQLVAEIAYNYLNDKTKAALKHYLKKTTIEEAATWMDENRSNNYYDYMKTWHYIDFEKDSVYRPSKEANALTVLNSTVYYLKHKENLKDSKIKEYLMITFHLVGDLHQPLHTGYSSDRGGNDVQIKAPSYRGNLHSFWDTEMLEEKNITLDDCLKQYENYKPEEINAIKKISVYKWMTESRALLDSAYNFKDGKVEQFYIDSNAQIIKKQLLIAGLRLASILEEIFKDEK